jgi:hypothetical protein
METSANSTCAVATVATTGNAGYLAFCGVLRKSDRSGSVAPGTQLARLQDCAIAYAQQAKSAATRKAYASDWKFFEAWCHVHHQAPLPASPATLALYLTRLARLGRTYSTIRRARIAVGQVHGL